MPHNGPAQIDGEVVITMKPLRHLIVLVLLAAFLVAPAAAVTIVDLPDSATTAYDEWTTYVDLNAYDPGGAVIGEIAVEVPPNTLTEFTLYDYEGTITGEINRTTTATNTEEVSYKIGDQEAGPYERTAWFPGTSLPDKELFTIKYGVYDDGERHLWMQPWGKGGTWDNLGYNISNVIYRASFSSTPETHVMLVTVPADDMSEAINQRADATGGNLLAGFLDLLMSLLGGVYFAISVGWYAFNVLFLENFWLFLGLYEIIGLAYAANKSKDIFQFMKKVANYNAAALKAMLWLIDALLEIVTKIVNALKPV